MTNDKKETITTLGDADKLIVQKSRPLLALYNSDLTLEEFKILDLYLSRINSHNPNKRVVEFSKGEMESIMGIKQIKPEALQLRLKHLMGNVVKIPDDNSTDSINGFRMITLFEESVAMQDESGIWNIKMECTQKAMKYFFNVENIGYLRYKLRCITSITSRYTYIFFNYLEFNRFRKTWKVDVDELKKILQCDNVEAYKQYKYFNNLILKKIEKELLEKTECHFSYEPIKNGRSVVAIQITVETLSDKLINNDPIIPKPEKDEREEPMWHEVLSKLDLSKEQICEIDSVLVTLPDQVLPEVEEFQNDIAFRRYHYLEQKIYTIFRRNKEKPIKNKFAYLIKIMKNESDNNK